MMSKKNCCKTRNWLILFSCILLGGEISAQSWTRELPGLGTFSSPRVSDLNGDGIGDLVLGAGREEFISCDSAVFALDGKTGEMLWKVSARDQMFGSACLQDLNQDGIEDVLINGRSAELKAINGATGELLWEFIQLEDSVKAADLGWYNFYNPQLIPDQNDDGRPDILVSNGGDVMVQPYDPNRPAGKLVVISSVDGSLLAEALMPDGKETYMSIAVAPIGPDSVYQVIFGTGGETIGGNLYVAPLSAVLAGDLSAATRLASSPDKGFIAPPVWVDVTGDETKDIVAIAVDGRVLSFDGNNYQALWATDLPDTEAYSSLTVGYFSPDETPDFFVSVGQGEWPKLEWNRQFMLDGSNGEILYQDSLGFYQTCTAVATDLTGNGREEVLMSLNYQVQNKMFQKYFYNMLIVIKFDTKEAIILLDDFEGSNISSSPWIGDLDRNGKLDIIHIQGTNLRHTYTFDGMKIHRFSTDIQMYKTIKWGAYMGSKYDGVFE